MAFESPRSPQADPETSSRSGRPLKLALVAPPWFTIPPSGYGGIERVVAILADGLARRGHEVTLFAPGGSRTAACLVETFAQPMSSVLGNALVDAESSIRAYRRWREFDVIHDHTVVGLVAASMIQRPVVHTVHGVVLPELASLYSAMGDNVELVAISESQRRSLPAETSSTLIRNAVDVERIPWNRAPGEYLLFVGRASPEKGLLDAVEIANRTDLPLRMFIKVNEPLEHEYFESLRPHLEGPRIEVELEASERTKEQAYAGAYATLFPVHWEEPFGLVMIESMAAGTPVIGYRRGAVPEVIAHGVSGFVCDTLEEAAAAVPLVASLDREASRRHVETRFNAEHAVRQHEALYASLVGQSAK